MRNIAAKDVTCKLKVLHHQSFLYQTKHFLINLAFISQQYNCTSYATGALKVWLKSFFCACGKVFSFQFEATLAINNATITNTTSIWTSQFHA